MMMMEWYDRAISTIWYYDCFYNKECIYLSITIVRDDDEGAMEGYVYCNIWDRAP